MVDLGIARAAPEPAGLLPHQWEVVRALDAWLDGGHRGGLVVLPTGAGKSRCASTWIARRVLPRGLRILWLAHRQALLDQATVELRRALPGRAVRAISSLAEPMSALRGTDRVVVGSIGTLTRQPRRLGAWLKAGPALVVLDEAHHAPAPTFRRVLELADRHGALRLGLTATPTRSRDAERPVLSRLFDDLVVAKVEAPPLVERGVLARATLVRVPTGAVADEGMTAREVRRLGQHVELPAVWLRRLAELAPRNEAIVRHLIDHRERYSPALVVACDVRHAALLARRLSAEGLRARYVASYRPDGTHEAPEGTLRAFRADELDVLVSVDLLSEGVDLPNARSLHLVRPVRSPVLLRQLVGRVLRGPLVGGTPDAWVVAFKDVWTRLAHVHVTAGLVVGEGALPPAAASGRGHRAPDDDGVPFADLAKAETLLRVKVDLRDTIEVPQTASLVVRGRDGSAHLVPILSAQELGWSRLLARVGELPVRGASSLDPAELIAACFPWWEDAPPAAVEDVRRVLEHVASGAPTPLLEPIAAPWHPTRVALSIRRDDLGERARVALLRELHPAASAVYPTLDDYRSAIDFALRQPRREVSTR